MSETTKQPSITDGKLRIWTEDDATMHGEGHVTPTQFYERVRGRKFYSAQIERSVDESDWIGHLMKDGWVVANSPMGGEVYMPMPKETAALAAEVERLRAALEFYADENNWKHHPKGSDFHHEADADGGNIARRALEAK